MALISRRSVFMYQTPHTNHSNPMDWFLFRFGLQMELFMQLRIKIENNQRGCVYHENRNLS